MTVSAASGARDNLAVTRPSPSTLRVTDLPGGAYTGSGVHTGAGCTQSGDNGANCTGSITLIQITAGDQAPGTRVDDGLPERVFVAAEDGGRRSRGSAAARQVELFAGEGVQ